MPRYFGDGTLPGLHGRSGARGLARLYWLRLYRRRRDGIPREWYSREYFLSDRCEGFAEFSRSGGLSHVKQRLLAKLAPAPADRILELGCGRGEVLRACGENARLAVGIDSSTEAVRLSRTTAEGRACVVRADVEALPFRDGAFTKICIGDVLEHLTRGQAERALAEAHRALTTDGLFVLHTSPNVLFIRLVFPWALLALLAVGRLRLLRLLIAQYRTIRRFHVCEYSAGGLRRLFDRSAFRWFAVECDPDLLRGGKSRYTEPLFGNPLVRKIALAASRPPLVRLFSNDLWVVARKHA